MDNENENSQGLGQQIRAMATSPVVLVLAVVVISGVIWGALHVSYRTILGNKDQHIAMLERRAAEYRDVVGGATPAEARRRIEAMELELRTLRLRLQPRRLAQEQRQAMMDRSRLPAGGQPRGVTVVVEGNCTDCAAFADGLIEALRDSQGWSVNRTVAATVSDRSRTGLAVRMPDRLRPAPEAVALQQAIRSAGLEFTTLSGSLDPNVELLVTERMTQ